jgi:hypothetical protein
VAIGGTISDYGFAISSSGDNDAGKKKNCLT